MSLVPMVGTVYIVEMQIVARRKLRDFWVAQPQAEVPLRAWYGLVSNADWTGPAGVRAMFNSADFLADSRVVFDIGGNKFRLIVHVAYPFKRVLIKFIGTHAEYDKISAETVR